MSNPKTNEPIRLVALDLDGTVLNSAHTVSPRTAEAIAAAIRRGVIVLPATGRPLGNLPDEIVSIPGVRYAITANGAAVWDLGENPVAAVHSRWSNAAEQPVQAAPVLLEKKLLCAKAAVETYQVFARFSGRLSIFVNGFSVMEPEALERMLKLHARLAGSPQERQARLSHLLVPSLADYIAANADCLEKFCMFFDGDPDGLCRAREALAAVSGIEVVQGAPNNLEVTAPGVSKGESLLALAAELGIPRGGVLAAGDSENDAEMLKSAGLAVVMANGMPHIKALADFVTEKDCDHDGVAELLEKFIL